MKFEINTANRRISVKCGINSFLYTLFAIATAMIGYHIHHSIFFAIINGIFAPFAWIIWLICHDVNLTIIKETFSWFLM